MTCSRTLLKLLAVIIFALSVHSTSNAQERYWVSGTGNDANPCFRLSPCRTFQRAHDVATAGHEIVVMDSAGYGPINITKSVSISGEGFYAGITVFAGLTGITINSPTAVVVLRNLDIDGLNGVGDHGIQVLNAASLHIENCIIHGLNGFGLVVSGGGGVNAGLRMAVKDTVIRNCMSNAFNAGKAVFENCRFEKNSTGIGVFSFGTASAVFHNCVMAGNTNFGLWVVSRAVVDHCQISNNATGVYANGGQIRVSNSNITENGDGLVFNSGGTILSRVTAAGALTNTLEDNTTNGAFTGTYLAK